MNICKYSKVLLLVFISMVLFGCAGTVPVWRGAIITAGGPEKITAEGGQTGLQCNLSNNVTLRELDSDGNPIKGKDIKIKKNAKGRIQRTEEGREPLLGHTLFVEFEAGKDRPVLTFTRYNIHGQYYLASARVEYNGNTYRAEYSGKQQIILLYNSKNLKNARKFEPKMAYKSTEKGIYKFLETALGSPETLEVPTINADKPTLIIGIYEDIFVYPKKTKTRNVTFTNRTGTPLVEIYVRETGTQNWSEIVNRRIKDDSTLLGRIGSAIIDVGLNELRIHTGLDFRNEEGGKVAGTQERYFPLDNDGKLLIEKVTVANDRNWASKIVRKPNGDVPRIDIKAIAENGTTYIVSDAEIKGFTGSVEITPAHITTDRNI